MEPACQNVKEAKTQEEFSKYLWDLRHWSIFKILYPEISEIHMVMVFGNANTKSALIVTKTKRVYAIGDNSLGQLGYGLSRNESYSVIEPKEIPELREINIKTIYTIHYSVFLITEEGKVFVWGDNNNGLLGLGESADKKIQEPTCLVNLCMEHIVDISCSIDFVLALTKDGRIYTWGHASNFQMYSPLQVKLELKVEQIACNSLFSVIVTKNHDVYIWNKDQMELQRNEIHVTLQQIGFGMIPEDTEIVKVLCGRSHALALTRNGMLYAWGDNTVGFLGLGYAGPSSDYPDLVKIQEVLDVAILPGTNLTAAVCKDKRIYVWGQCYGLEIKIPLVTSFSDIHEAFAYTFLGCMHKPLIISANRNSDEETEKKDLGDSSQSQMSDSLADPFDFTIKIGEEVLRVNKHVLKNRCQYFKSMSKSDWYKQSVIILGQFSPDIYIAFFEYFHTGRINVPVEKTFDLLTLAKMYEADDFMRDIEQMMMREITAIKYRR